jgi:hypothetical protein
MSFLTLLSREEYLPVGKLAGKLKLGLRLRVPCALGECRSTRRCRLPPPTPELLLCACACRHACLLVGSIGVAEGSGLKVSTGGLMNTL